MQVLMGFTSTSLMHLNILNDIFRNKAVLFHFYETLLGCLSKR